MWIIIMVMALLHLDASAGSSYLVCDSKWIKVLQTDDAGNAEIGSKTALMDALLHGAELQVFVPDWGYASSTQQIGVLNNNIDICAQAIFHISKDSWESFHSDTYWYFLNLCTSGFIEKARWYVGAHMQPSSAETSAQTTSRLRIVWFVRYHGYGSRKADPVYCNSDQGIRMCGSLSNLVETVKMGAHIRAVDASHNGITPFNHLQVSNNDGLVSGQYIWSVSLNDKKDHSTFQKDAYWWFSIWSTIGLLDMSRWNIGSHDDRTHSSTNIAINWFADTCWMLAYKHDELGSPVDGSLDFLRSAILSGHKVKLVMGNYSIEADNLVLKNGDISAQLLGHVSKVNGTHFHPNGYWYWNHVSTSGKVETIRYDVGSTTDEGSSNSTSSVSWFIDSRPWKHVLSTSQHGLTTFGSKTNLITSIREGSQLRCVIKFSSDHILVAEADNVEFSPGDTNLGAQILRIVSYTTEETSSRHFENVPYWKFTIATTTGTVRQSDWIVGAHTTRGTEPLTADIDWFVN